MDPISDCPNPGRCRHWPTTWPRLCSRRHRCAVTRVIAAAKPGRRQGATVSNTENCIRLDTGHACQSHLCAGEDHAPVLPRRRCRRYARPRAGSNNVRPSCTRRLRPTADPLRITARISSCRSSTDLDPCGFAMACIPWGMLREPRLLLARTVLPRRRSSGTCIGDGRAGRADQSRAGLDDRRPLMSRHAARCGLGPKRIQHSAGAATVSAFGRLPPRASSCGPAWAITRSGFSNTLTLLP